VAALLADGPKRERLAQAGRDRLSALGLAQAADRFIELVQTVMVPS
jgi:hypothetical protein